MDSVTFGDSPMGHSSVPMVTWFSEVGQRWESWGWKVKDEGLKLTLSHCRWTKSTDLASQWQGPQGSYHGTRVFLPRAAGSFLCLLGRWKLAAGFLSQRGLESRIFGVAAWHIATCFLDFNLEKRGDISKHRDMCYSGSTQNTQVRALGQPQSKHFPGSKHQIHCPMRKKGVKHLSSPGEGLWGEPSVTGCGED